MMVAYNFKSAFHGAIIFGAKRQTVRHAGKKRHARPGERVQIYKGLRTKDAAKLIPDPVCKRIDAIMIVVGREHPNDIGAIEINGIPLDAAEAEDFARRDGFGNLAQFGRFWRVTHGAGRFEGVVIVWEPI
ncbi:MAG: ASCH domain-containing protein [Devosia sp.]